VIDPRPLWDFDDPAGSGERFLEAAERAEEPDRTSWLSQYARALGLQERYEEATRLLDELSADAAEAPEAPEAAAYLALERGRVLRSSGQAEESRAHFARAAATAEAAGLEALHVDVLHMVALAAPQEEQLALNEQALAVARAATDPRARDWDASLLHNIGMTHADADDYPAALAAFEEALTARERMGDPATIRVARWMIGWTYRQLGRRDEALEIQRALKAELDSIGESDEYVDQELALLAE
jgi:tetratricopeptide (TPR) repeat protein